jgi:hypothetical protein
MYSLFRSDPIGSLGIAADPNLPYIRRTYDMLIKDVKSYYRKAPKFADASNVIAKIVNHFLVEFKSSDSTFAATVDDQSKGLIANLGIVSAINRGKIFTTGVTLGPQTEEILVATFERFDTSNLKARWKDLQPIRYLYHTRTDCNLPIMNNTTPGRGYGVTQVNIPMLLVQYRYWLASQMITDIQPMNVYKFIGAYPLVNAIESYLDIAYFNRLSRQAYGIKNQTYPLPHPFYLTDLTPKLEKLAEYTNKQRAHKAVQLEQLAQITPMVTKDSLYRVIQLPREPVTLQNEWALAMARLPYIKYLVNGLKQAPSFDRNQTNEVLMEVRESMASQAFSMNGSSPAVMQFKKDVQLLIDEIK